MENNYYTLDLNHGSGVLVLIRGYYRTILVALDLFRVVIDTVRPGMLGPLWEQPLHRHSQP